MRTTSSTEAGTEGSTPGVLRDVADAGADLGRRPAEDRDRAAGRLEQAEHDFQQRGLAAAVGADDPQEFPRLDAERDVQSTGSTAGCGG